MSYDTQNEALLGLGKVVCAATFSAWTTNANSGDIVVTLYDFKGDVITDQPNLSVYTSDADGLMTDGTSDMAVTGSGSGFFVGAILANKAAIFQPAATGLLSVTVNDTGDGVHYLNVQSQNGQVFTSATAVTLAT